MSVSIRSYTCAGARDFATLDDLPGLAAFVDLAALATLGALAAALGALAAACNALAAASADLAALASSAAMAALRLFLFFLRFRFLYFRLDLLRMFLRSPLGLIFCTARSMRRVIRLLSTFAVGFGELTM